MRQTNASVPGVDLSGGVLLPLICRAITKESGAFNELSHARRPEFFGIPKPVRDATASLESRFDVEERRGCIDKGADSIREEKIGTELQAS
ncbi:MAG: hypothetical protein F4213_00550 [Boseongicola sp. SB0677_bin_26]|nr:hypothetical protein [Boseongicola sp. SB0665_bin_10]MYG24503.1 hypothetical protein [Boseongicola sp. SB0677_bin_26]